MLYRLKLIMTICVALASVLCGQASLFDTREQAGVPRQPKSLPPYQVPVEGTALEMAIAPEDYKVGPGDQFIVSLLSSEPYIELATVSPTGILVLPDIGAVSVIGMTAEVASQRVSAYIREIYPTSETTCALYGIRGIRVSVSGAVKSPGFHDVTPLSRLTDLLASAGGVLPRAAIQRVRLARAGEEDQILDLIDYYHDGDLSQNPLLEAGDRIIVPPGDLDGDLVMVRGLGAGPSYQVVRSGETLAAFIRRVDRGKAADLGHVMLERRPGSAAEEPLFVPLEQYSATTLQAGDVVYIDALEEISVVGEVHRPGRHAYQPGLTAQEYIVLSAGVTRYGSARKVEIIRSSGKTLRGRATVVQAGDTIYVPRSFSSVFLGQLGMVQAALTFLNIYLAYLAASRG